jgi:GxxExxY protein
MDLNELTYRINGAVYEVNKELGVGFLEKVYENALLIELKHRGLRLCESVCVCGKGYSVSLGSAWVCGTMVKK